MLQVLELIAIVVLAGATGWMTQARVEERLSDRLF